MVFLSQADTEVEVAAAVAAVAVVAVAKATGCVPSMWSESP